MHLGASIDATRPAKMMKNVSKNFAPDTENIPAESPEQEKREACLRHGLTGGQRRSDTGGKSLLLSWLNTENLCCAFIVFSLPSLRLLSPREEPKQAREHGLVCPFIKHFSGKKAEEPSKESFLISRRTAQVSNRDQILFSLSMIK